MAASNGVCTFLSDGPIIPGKEWLADLASLSPGLSRNGHVRLRMPLSSDAHTDRLDLDAVRAASRLYRAAGFHQAWTLHSGTCRPYVRDATPDPSHYPNAPLGYNGDNLNNWYIEHLSLTALSFLRQLGDDAPDELFLFNEPNLHSVDMQPGDHCPPEDPNKGSALAPEVFGALLYQCARRLRGNIATKVIRPAPFSLLLSQHTDPRSDWFLGYWQRAIDYVRAMGVGDLVLDGVCLNCEGVVDSPSGAEYVAQAMRDVMAYGNWSGHLVIAECGAPAGNLNPPVLASSYSNLKGPMDYLYVFQHPVRIPGDLSGYGMTDYDYSPEGTFRPTRPTALKPFYTEQFAK